MMIIETINISVIQSLYYTKKKILSVSMIAFFSAFSQIGVVEVSHTRVFSAFVLEYRNYVRDTNSPIL